MQEAIIYEKLLDSRVRCNTCQWHCRINPDQFGVCGMYQNQGGILYNLNYARVSSLAVDPIEKKPLFHFHPGTEVFSVGTLGCNFHCKHCQNWQISMSDSSALLHKCQDLLPEAAIEMAKGYHSQGIAWTYNEPAIWLEYTLDCAKLAKKNNLYTVYVTNGYSTPESLDTIGPYLDAWRVDVKGFSDAFYRDIAKVPAWREILAVTQRARQKWNMHVEVVTNIIPDMNDDDAQIEGIARWIHDELGELTPWHVTRFYPMHEMMDAYPTPLETLEHACELGHRAGLKFVYTGNVPGHASENTTCYNCGRLVVQRQGYQTRVVGLKDSHCRFCGVGLNFRTAAPAGG